MSQKEKVRVNHGEVMKLRVKKKHYQEKTLEEEGGVGDRNKRQELEAGGKSGDISPPSGVEGVKEVVGRMSSRSMMA